jgi:hypothetical protein
MAASRIRAVSLIAGLAALAVLPASAATAKPTAEVTGLTAYTGASAGAPLPITPKVRVSGGTAAVTVTATLSGRRIYKLTGAGKKRFSGSKAVAFAPTVPKKAAAGTYALTVCVTPAKPKKGCRRLKAKVSVLTLSTKPNPLTAPRTLDVEHATTGTIGPAGGTLSTTAADGSVARLTIPAKALPMATEITMTPVTRIDGHPAKPGVLAGVQLTPDGQQLAIAAKLELIPQLKTKPVQRTVLTSDAGGTNTRPELFKDAGDGATLSLLHFSSYELAYVGFNDRAAQRALLDRSKFPPGPNLEQLTAKLAETLGVERQRQLLGTDTPEETARVQAEIAAVLEAYYNGQIVPQLEQAKGNCQIAPLALEGAYGWERLVGLTGLADRYKAELANLSRLEKAVIQGALLCFHKRCVQDNFPEAFDDYLELYGRAVLLAIEPPYELNDEIRRCLRFKVEIESDLSIAAGTNPLGGQRSGPGYHYTLRGEAPAPEPGLGVPSSFFAVLLDYASFSGSTSDFYPGTFLACTDKRITEVAAHGNAGTVTVSLETLKVRHEFAQTARDFLLKVNAGDVYDSAASYGGPFETYGTSSTGSGANCDDTYEEAGNRWARVFDFVGARDTRTNAPMAPSIPYQLAGFTRGANPVYMQRTKRDIGNVGGYDFDITTTIRIIHTPLRVG